MTLTTGTRLGPYEIVEVLGAGGMGVVYKAHDPHLNRLVALKVLRAADLTGEQRARFLREARAASALNHPHIVRMYDIARAADDDFLVMEYVEGETLDRLIGTRRLPLRDAIRYAAQMADALAAAHASGIVHRDLKPGNIIVTADSRTRERTAKLLDFGIAKWAEESYAPAGAATRTAAPETTEGTLLGTICYMSPEQLEGRSIDARSDVFSFGTLLYEMVTGRQPFARGSTLATAGAILHEDPAAVAELMDHLPGELSILVSRCLRKDPRRRLQVMDDVKIVLEDMLDRSAAIAVEPGKVRTGRSRWRRVAAIGTLAGVLVAAAMTLGYPDARRVPLATSAFQYTPLATEPYFEGYPAWSPDGRTVAYLADRDGERHIFARSLDAAVPTRITSSPQHASHLFWSHDGGRIYYSRGNTVWSISVAGGEPRLELEDARIAAMSRDGRMMAFLRGPGGNSTLWFLSTDGRGPEQYRTPPFPERFFFSYGLDFSPDGNTLAVLVEPRERTAFETELWVVPVASGTPRRAVERAPYGSAESRVSWAVDNRHVVLTGSVAGAGVSGKHLYLADTETGSVQLLTSGVLNEVSPSVSPDGSRVAFASGSADADLIQIAIDGSDVRPLLASARDERDPSWTPAGNQVAYVTDARGSPEVWMRTIADGWSAPVVTLDSAGMHEWQSVRTPAISPDGQRIAYVVISATHGVHVSPVAGGRGVLLDTESTDQHSPSWSPDGRWICYQRLGGDGWELVKIAVGGGSAIRLADANPGGEPRVAWSPTGEWIAQTRAETLRVVSADGTRTRDLGPGSPAFGFSRDGSLLHALRRSSSGAWEIVNIEIPSGIERRVTSLNLSRDALVSGFSLHPDGKSFAVSVAVARYDIWLLEGFGSATRGLSRRFWPW